MNVDGRCWVIRIGMLRCLGRLVKSCESVWMLLVEVLMVMIFVVLVVFCVVGVVWMLVNFVILCVFVFSVWICVSRSL